jgi:hypothetical protein
MLRAGSQPGPAGGRDAGVPGRKAAPA